MKGYEGCYDSENETQEERAGKHSQKITNRAEEGRGVEGVSCPRLDVGVDGTRRKKNTMLKWNRDNSQCKKKKKKKKNKLPTGQLQQQWIWALLTLKH